MKPITMKLEKKYQDIYDKIVKHVEERGYTMWTYFRVQKNVNRIADLNQDEYEIETYIMKSPLQYDPFVTIKALTMDARYFGVVQRAAVYSNIDDFLADVDRYFAKGSFEMRQYEKET